MNMKLITVACLALILAGCGDKDDTATGTAEPGMMDKTMDAAGEMAEDAGEMTSDAVDATKETIHDAAQGVADATAPEVEDAETDAAADTMDKTGGAMGQ